MNHDDDKYAAYARTVLELPGVPDGRIDLRRAIGPPERTALAAVGRDRPFALMTTENPCGENDEDARDPATTRQRAAANDRALAALVGDLAARGVPFVRVDGAAPNGEYHERCVAVVAPRGEAIGLARRYAQLALFWYDGEAFWLLPAEADGVVPRRLPIGAG